MNMRHRYMLQSLLLEERAVMLQSLSMLNLSSLSLPSGDARKGLFCTLDTAMSAGDETMDINNESDQAT
jgi:hypothetical protein